jgi:hypothetical protein
MKTQILLSTLLAMSLFGVGCAKKSEAPVVSPVAVDPTASPDPTRGPNPGLSYSSGATAEVTLESISALTQYSTRHPLNAPTKFQVNVNLNDTGNGRYAGKVQFSYYDNGNYYNGIFQVGTRKVVTSYKNIDTGKPENEFNQWFTFNGKKVFHGFFEEQDGSLILVIDDALGSGDGGIASEVSGSIWFKNFQPAYPGVVRSPEKCWFLREGPFDCRTFIGSNGAVNTTQAVEPSTGDGYIKLGRFTGLNMQKAFNTP